MTVKHSVILIIKHKNKILIQTSISSQGHETIDVFGTFYIAGQDPLQTLIPIYEPILGKDVHLKHFGRLVDYITKPEGEIKLSTIAYSVDLTDEQANYAVLQPNYFWVNETGLSTDKRARRDNHLHRYYFGDKVFNIEFAEDQLGTWIDARLKWIKEVK